MATAWAGEADGKRERLGEKVGSVEEEEKGKIKP